MRTRNNVCKGRKKTVFTLIELLIVIGIIAVLASILLPALKRSRAKAKQMFCLNSMKQYGIGIMNYSIDNTGVMPIQLDPNTNAPPTKALLNNGYVSKETMYGCPECNFKIPEEWWLQIYFPDFGIIEGMFNGLYDCYKITQVKTPSGKMYLLDGWRDDASGLPAMEKGYFRVGNLLRTSVDYASPGVRHNGFVNIQWLDGHCSKMKAVSQMSPYTGYPFNIYDDECKKMMKWNF